MLRVLSLNYEFPPIGGGGGNAHKHILQEFRHFPDIEITLVTSTIDSKPSYQMLAPNVRLCLLPIKKKDLLYWRRGEIIKYLTINYGFMKEYLKTQTFDLCHVFFGFPSGLLAYLFRSRMPYIVSVRGSDVPGYNKRFALDYILLRPFLKRIYSSASAVVANSRGLSNLFHEQFPHLNAPVIPNGIDTEAFAPQPKSNTNGLSLVTVARLIPRKGIDLLIRACAEINREQILFNCHIIGDGPEEDNLKKMSQELGVAERVHFHGRMNKESVAGFLPKCDIFVLPSYAEGMSNAALEAMGCGLPLLLTDTGGSRELVDGNGRIIPTGDASELADVLRDWYVKPELVNSMGQRSRICANAFSWTSVAQRYRDMYIQLAENRK